MTKLKRAVFNELTKQEAPDFIRTQPLPLGDEYRFTASEDHHALRYIPPVSSAHFPHSIFVTSPSDLLKIFELCEDFSGGVFSTKIPVIEHETQHAEAAIHLGSKSVRYLACLSLEPVLSLVDGRKVRPVSLKAAVIMDDLHVSRLGAAIMLSAPTEPSESDRRHWSEMGYADSEEIKMLATTYNQQVGKAVYPVYS